MATLLRAARATAASARARDRRLGIRLTNTGSWQFEEEQQWNAADAASPAARVQRFVADALDRARDGSRLSIARGTLQSFSTHERTEENEGEPYGRCGARQNDGTGHRQ